MKKIFLLLFILLFTITFPKTSLIYGGTISESTSQIRVLFSPQDNCAQEIISAINNAKNNVYVAMYYFTSNPIARALVDASLRGVKVRVCMDGSDPHYEYSKRVYLENKNIPIRVITGKGIMHNKFCVIDDEVVITGSFNWTARADLENDENILIIRSDELAKRYKEEFENLWNAKKIDAFQYTDETRAEKVSLEGFVTVVPLLATHKNIYIGHRQTKKFHLPSCRWAGKIKAENKIEFSTRQEAVDKGYFPCKACKP